MKRIVLLAELLLIEAESRAKTEDKKAYVHVVGRVARFGRL